MLKDHNSVTPVRLEPAAPRSRVKHSTTEPLLSLLTTMQTAMYGPYIGSCVVVRIMFHVLSHLMFILGQFKFV